MNFDNYKFHPSGVEALNTKPKSKKAEFSETAITYLTKIWAEETKQVKEEIENKYCAKGTTVESESIELLNEYSGTNYEKNELQINNDFFIGTPDILTYPVIDIKSSWNYLTFLKAISKPTNKVYIMQVNCYADIMDIDKGELCYALVNTPESIVNRELNSLNYKGYTEKKIQDEEERIILLHNFDRFKIEERLYFRAIARNDELLDNTKKEIIKARKWLNNYDPHKILI